MVFDIICLDVLIVCVRLEHNIQYSKKEKTQLNNIAITTYDYMCKSYKSKNNIQNTNDFLNSNSKMI